MRQERTVQATIFEVFARTRDRLRAEGDLGMAGWAARAGEPGGGRSAARRGCARPGGAGLPAETVLRCALLKQQRQLSYEELAFHLEEFGLVSRLCPPAAGVVAEEVGAAPDDQRRSAPRPGRRSIRHCWPAPNRTSWKSGAMVRIDSTVTAALMHEPSDSALLWDAVRVMTRLLRPGGGVAGSAGDALARPPAPGQEAGRARSNTAAAKTTGASSTAS